MWIKQQVKAEIEKWGIDWNAPEGASKNVPPLIKLLKRAFPKGYLFVSFEEMDSFFSIHEDYVKEVEIAEQKRQKELHEWLAEVRANTARLERFTDPLLNTFVKNVDPASLKTPQKEKLPD